jgi:glycosyltransferase involved in cell wall biosynthesis
MRIVIDMQGAQSESRFRGIGRYTMSFTQALVRNRGDHEIILALNGLFPDTIEPIRAAFDSLLPQENIRVWHAPGPVRDLESSNEGRREVAEIIREAFLASLQPDIIHISSLFEGFVDDVVTSIGRFDQRTPVSVSLYDLIPLLNPEKFLDPNPLYKKNYLTKLDHLKKASLYLAISDFTLQECRSHFPFVDKQGINVSTAIESHFKPLNLEKEAFENLKQKFSISRPFIFYTGGADDHKNLPRLIEAFAALKPDIRAKYQIVFGGRIPEGNRSLLRHHAKSCGLKPDDMLFTGYLSEEELVSLYNLCRLMAFPSWHESFGLPVLEAMSCGAPVICGSRSSLPEVIGLEEAMFDPFDVKSIATKMSQALEDETFRARLRSYGLKRAKLFSWDESAKKAIVGFEKIHSSHRQNISLIQPIAQKPKLAFVSPLPPERTGIADFCAELLPSLAKYYDIELIVAQENIDPEILARFPKPKKIDWLIQNASKIDRVLYHFGNSPFHSHMFNALDLVSGVVVLHDLFLGHVIRFDDISGLKPKNWERQIYSSHGYKALRESLISDNVEIELFKYPCSNAVAQGSMALIVHSGYSKSVLENWYGKTIADKCYALPLARALPSGFDRESARAKLGIKADDFIFCSFGFLQSTKLNDRLLLSWLRSSLSKNKNCYLVFVGENTGGEYGQNLDRLIKANNLSSNVQITGFVSHAQYRDYLSAMDAAVQLRTNSRGETSAAVLDVMASGKPLIVNAHGSLAELDSEAVCVIPDEFEDAQLAHAMETIHADAPKAQRMGDLAREIVANKHSPENCAAEYFKIIETCYHIPRKLSPKVINAISDRVLLHESSNNLSDISKCLAATWPAQERKKCLFLDISATCVHDLKTGIERVTRALLIAFLEREDIRCEPVRLVFENGKWVYRYARAYTSNLLEIPQLFEDELVETLPGDVLLSLDLSGGMLIGAEQQGLYRALRNQGVAVYHIVFDLLPVRIPKVFPPGASESHEQWLRSVAKSDGVFCISKSVAEDFSQWLTEKQVLSEQRLPFSVDWFHLSPEIFASSPTLGLPVGADKVLKKFQVDITFLMVGTIEPRKGYLQTLEAFDILWQDGVAANLVFVGKEGWQPLTQEARRDIPETISRIKNHPQLNKRLFWLEGISDEYLEKVYASSTCLIAGSYGEGFGLPLIEAAQHRLPILARDIPVFREVAGEHAAYFKAETPNELAGAIKSWLADCQKNKHPKSSDMNYLTWKESAAMLLNKICQGETANDSEKTEPLAWAS